MRCARYGCNNPVPPRRRKYCSDKCGKMAGHERVLEQRRTEQLHTTGKRFRRQKLRTCLGCNKEFMSGGPWNRFCQTCAQKNQARRMRVFSVRAGIIGRHLKE